MKSKTGKYEQDEGKIRTGRRENTNRTKGKYEQDEGGQGG